MKKLQMQNAGFWPKNYFSMLCINKMYYFLVCIALIYLFFVSHPFVRVLVAYARIVCIVTTAQLLRLHTTKDKLSRRLEPKWRKKKQLSTASHRSVKRRCSI